MGVGTRDGEGTAIALNISQLYEAKAIPKGRIEMRDTRQAASDKARGLVGKSRGK